MYKDYIANVDLPYGGTLQVIVRSYSEAAARIRLESFGYKNVRNICAL